MEWSSEGKPEGKSKRVIDYVADPIRIGSERKKGSGAKIKFRVYVDVRGKLVEFDMTWHGITRRD